MYVDSIRPFSGTVDRRGQVKMLADVADRRQNRTEALDLMMDSLPQSMTAGWSIVLDTEPRTHRVAASSAAPADNGKELESAPVVEARVLNSEREDWIPENWAVMDSALAATPSRDITSAGHRAPGRPDFLLSEVEHLRQMGSIVGAFFS